MRVIGYILLLGGFLLLLEHGIWAAKRAGLQADYDSERLSQQQAYTKEEVRAVMHNRAVLVGVGASRGVISYSVVMLIGGVILGLAPRPEKRLHDAAEPKD
jgi:hypothetical protein